MKKIAKTTIVLLLILSALVVAPVNKANAQIGASVSLQVFYDDLAPYGQWVDDPGYGDYVWVPDAEPDFRPYYTDGHWVMTKYGATWVSDYSWGWAPFHYGRWTYSRYYGGWVWKPDTQWGPAWVSWRSGNDYYGWAPMAPGFSLSITFGSYSSPYDSWVFIPQQYLLSPSFYSYSIAPDRNISYIQNSTIINNTYYYDNVLYPAGPRMNQIESVTHSKVQVYNIADGGGPGKTSLQGNTVNTYRPRVTKSSKGNAKPMPSAVVDRDQFTKNKAQRSDADVAKNNNEPGNTKQIEKKQVQLQNNKQDNNKQAMPDRTKKVNQPTLQTEKIQVQPQNNNKQVIPDRTKKVNQPPQQSEKKQVQPQNNNKQAIPQPQQQSEKKQVQPQNNNKQAIPQPQQQSEKKQVQPQNNNKQAIPQPQQQTNQQPQQQVPKQSNPGKKGNGKGNN